MFSPYLEAPRFHFNKLKNNSPDRELFPLGATILWLQATIKSDLKPEWSNFSSADGSQAKEVDRSNNSSPRDPKQGE